MKDNYEDKFLNQNMNYCFTKLSFGTCILRPIGMKRLNLKSTCFVAYTQSYYNNF